MRRAVAVHEAAGNRLSLAAGFSEQAVSYKDKPFF
jgi:hypothetical protein